MLPFLKWAGGKRWLAGEIQRWVPAKYNLYLEPFLGGGACFFHLEPQRAVLSDTNSDLIETYRAIQVDPSAVRSALKRHKTAHSDGYYYEMRSRCPSDSVERAARFLYLNRTCWNGLYRVNLKGEFNVPRGTKDLILLPDEDFKDVARALAKAEVQCCDFAQTLARAQRGDLVYVDPPYTVKHNYNGFIKYNQSIFSWDDQVRLRDACFDARVRGATVIISNADHMSVRELYREADLAESVSRASVIAGKSAARQRTTELLAVLRGLE